MKLSIVIPSFNVGETIGGIVSELKKSHYVHEIIVVDNNSSDITGEVAKQNGATVITCFNQGLGFAVKAGIEKSECDFIMKIDGDIYNPNSQWINRLVKGMTQKIVYISGIYNSSYDEYPVGNLVAKPALKLRHPYLNYVVRPLSGTYLFNKNMVDVTELPDNWAFDLSLLIKSHHISGIIGQVEIGMLNDKQKQISEYKKMAFELLQFLFD